MGKKVLKWNIEKHDVNQQLPHNDKSNLSRLEMTLEILEELNIDKQNGSISITEYYLRKSKIIKELYSQDL